MRWMETSDITKGSVLSLINNLNSGPSGKIGKSQLSQNLGCNRTICGIKGINVQNRSQFHLREWQHSTWFCLDCFWRDVLSYYFCFQTIPCAQINFWLTCMTIMKQLPNMESMPNRLLARFYPILQVGLTSITNCSSWSCAQILWLSAANASGNSDNLFVGDIVKLRCKKSLRPTKLPMVDDQDDDPTDGTLTTYCMPPINMGEFGEWELTPTFQSVCNNVKIPALSLLWLVWFFNTSGHKDLST